ncbi:MAG: hypothetical protein LH660_06180 [Phormidesmis sp. CAN_BIN36]|nr:hypothetical protein [Phormidesmis sp. CAN_BIN36]
MQLSEAELSQVQQTLRDYEPSQSAIATLLDHDGDLDTSLEAMLRSEMGQAAFGDKPLKQVVLDVLREQICGDDGFRQRVTAYTKKTEDTPLLTSLIVYLTSQIVLPFPINPGLATLIVLYLAKFGFEVYCRYTEPAK